MTAYSNGRTPLPRAIQNTWRNVGQQRASQVLVASLILFILNLALGTSPLVAALAIMGLWAGFSLYILEGWNPYSFLLVLTYIQYQGAALILKPLSGQPLDLRLHVPVVSYAMTSALMLVVSMAISSGRAIGSHGADRAFLSFPLNSVALERSTVISLCIGTIGLAIATLTQSRVSGIYSYGAPYTIGAYLGDSIYLGLICALYNAHLTRPGRSLFTPSVVAALGLSGAGIILTNDRIWGLKGLLALALFMLINRRLRFGHVLVGLLFGLTLINIVSPVILEVRANKYSGTPTEFVQLTISSLSDVIFNPSLRRSLKEHVNLSYRAQHNGIIYDYYGDFSNIKNRYSFVALTDAVAGAHNSHIALGWRPLIKSVQRSIPRAIYPGKPIPRYSLGDWLAWNTGLVPVGISQAVNFTLPNEGLSSFGYGAYFLYPFLGISILISILTLISKYDKSGIVCMYLIVGAQNTLIEGTSDTYMQFVLTTIPVRIAQLLIIVALAKFSANIKRSS